MKIRNGFVSNSSSASYMITVHNIEEEDFYRKCYDYGGWSIFSISKIEEILKNSEEYDEFSSEFLITLTKIWNEEKLKLKEELERKEFKKKIGEFFQEIDDLKDYINFTNKVNYSNSNISYDKNTNSGYITGENVMDNDYDDTPELIKVLLCGFSFENEYKLSCIKKDL